MRLITLGWTDAEWDPDTEERMVTLIAEALTEGFEKYWVPPDLVTLSEPIDR